MQKIPENEFPFDADPNDPNISFTYTNDGYFNPDNKKTAVWTIKNMFDGVIRVPEIENSGFSNQLLYKYWGGVEEAERDIFEVGSWTCRICGETFKQRNQFVLHTRKCGGSSDRAYRKAASLLKNVDVTKPNAVYQLIIEHECDGEFYYYVGVSKNLEARISQHIRKNSGGILIAHDENRIERCVNYSVYGVKLIDEFDSRDEAELCEMFYPYQLAIEKNTTKILGGR